MEEEKSNNEDLLSISQFKNINSKHLRGFIMIKDLETNKKIGLNPFAGVYLSTIRCIKCGPIHELRRYEVFYDLSLEIK